MAFIVLLNLLSNFRINRREVLHVWKAKSGAAATYGNLMRICLENERRACAVVITKLWSSKYKCSHKCVVTVICLFFVVKIFSFPVHRTKIIFMKILGHEFLACMQLQVLC